MSEATFRLSAFGDEIADDLAAQLDTLAEQRIQWIEARAMWGKNILDLTDAELRAARTLLDTRGFGVSAIGSPIGKSSLEQPRDFELRRLEQAIHAADALGARLIRVFSFFVPQGGVDESVEREALARLRLLTAEAERARLTLVHENEKGIVGDSAERCRLLLSAIDSPALRQAFDPANFVQVGVHPMRDAWPLLAAYTTHVHIKDARFSDGAVYPPGQGDGALSELLEALAQTGYQGYLTLEPHLQFAGPAGGYSGPEGLRIASQALRALLQSCQAPIIVR